MTIADTVDDYGVLTAPLSLQIQRVLPGPIERVWDYLVREDLRRQWLASGVMELRQGAAFTLTWRNDSLNAPEDAALDCEVPEHSMDSRILEIDPPHKLTIAWMAGEVTFELAQSGAKVVLTLNHRRVSDRSNLLKVSAGWHAHLDILAARLTGKPVADFGTEWRRLHDEYAARLPS
jgi:uncharacterized protein YndB with AHSA1/START domain